MWGKSSWLHCFSFWCHPHGSPRPTASEVRSPPMVSCHLKETSGIHGREVMKYLVWVARPVLRRYRAETPARPLSLMALRDLTGVPSSRGHRWFSCRKLPILPLLTDSTCGGIPFQPNYGTRPRSQWASARENKARWCHGKTLRTGEVFFHQVLPATTGQRYNKKWNSTSFIGCKTWIYLPKQLVRGNSMHSL